MRVVVLDTGGSSIKAGIVGSGPPRVIPNAVVRSKGDKATYIGHELETTCVDHSALTPTSSLLQGYIVDWDAQKAVWDAVFSTQVLNVNPTISTLTMTEPYFNLPKIQETTDEFIFEEYEFRAAVKAPRTVPARLIPARLLSTAAAFMPYTAVFGYPGPECMVIVDSGFSFTHVVPLMNGRIVWEAVKRLDVGGKLLTNQLKELVSFRQWNMMDETYIMNHVKETCCFVSQDFKADLETCRFDNRKAAIVQEYVLPDLMKQKAGRVRGADEIVLDTEQVLVMGNERFSVPEVIFRPDDIGLEQAGLADTVAASISLLPEDIQGMFWANIGLIGGNTKFPGFRTRLLRELESVAPAGSNVVIYQSDDSVLDAYYAAAAFAPALSTPELIVTREEFFEEGSSAMRRKMRAAGLDWQTSVETVEGDVRGTYQESSTDESGLEDGEDDSERSRGDDTQDEHNEQGKLARAPGGTESTRHPVHIRFEHKALFGES
ncbi:hypothetical protein HMN09_00302800 [Mycena chlorophos]|uniref:Actin-like protein ARP6 n=1 Tax=Mycena chlorophos TaxID=658473 RepID=A0A8H6TM61_MYCCL|nr:hypothetical protein HMN09_00302800 [Mycena chlorophos]